MQDWTQQQLEAAVKKFEMCKTILSVPRALHYDAEQAAAHVEASVDADCARRHLYASCRHSSFKPSLVTWMPNRGHANVQEEGGGRNVPLVQSLDASLTLSRFMDRLEWRKAAERGRTSLEAAARLLAAETRQGQAGIVGWWTQGDGSVESLQAYLRTGSQSARATCDKLREYPSHAMHALQGVYRDLRDNARVLDRTLPSVLVRLCQETMTTMATRGGVMLSSEEWRMLPSVVTWGSAEKFARVSAHVPSGGATAAAEAASASTCGGLVDQQEKEKQEEALLETPQSVLEMSKTHARSNTQVRALQEAKETKPGKKRLKSQGQKSNEEHAGEAEGKKVRVGRKPSVVTWMPSGSRRGRLFVVFGVISKQFKATALWKEFKATKKRANKWLKKLTEPLDADAADNSSSWSSMPSVVTWMQLRQPKATALWKEFKATTERANMWLKKLSEPLDADVPDGSSSWSSMPSVVTWMQWRQPMRGKSMSTYTQPLFARVMRDHSLAHVMKDAVAAADAAAAAVKGVMSAHASSMSHAKPDRSSPTPSMVSWMPAPRPLPTHSSLSACIGAPSVVVSSAFVSSGCLPMPLTPDISTVSRQLSSTLQEFLPTIPHSSNTTLHSTPRCLPPLEGVRLSARAVTSFAARIAELRAEEAGVFLSGTRQGRLFVVFGVISKQFKATALWKEFKATKKRANKWLKKLTEPLDADAADNSSSWSSMPSVVTWMQLRQPKATALWKEFKATTERANMWLKKLSEPLDADVPDGSSSWSSMPSVVTWMQWRQPMRGKSMSTYTQPLFARVMRDHSLAHVMKDAVAAADAAAAAVKGVMSAHASSMSHAKPDRSSPTPSMVSWMPAPRPLPTHSSLSACIGAPSVVVSSAFVSSGCLPMPLTPDISTVSRQLSSTLQEFLLTIPHSSNTTLHSTPRCLPPLEGVRLSARAVTSFAARIAELRAEEAGGFLDRLDARVTHYAYSCFSSTEAAEEDTQHAANTHAAFSAGNTQAAFSAGSSTWCTPPLLRRDAATAEDLSAPLHASPLAPSEETRVSAFSACLWSNVLCTPHQLRRRPLNCLPSTFWGMLVPPANKPFLLSLPSVVTWSSVPQLVVRPVLFASHKETSGHAMHESTLGAQHSDASMREATRFSSWMHAAAQMLPLVNTSAALPKLGLHALRDRARSFLSAGSSSPQSESHALHGPHALGERHTKTTTSAHIKPSQVTWMPAAVSPLAHRTAALEKGGNAGGSASGAAAGKHEAARFLDRLHASVTSYVQHTREQAAVKRHRGLTVKRDMRLRDLSACEEEWRRAASLVQHHAWLKRKHHGEACARDKEECARNRMSSLARDRASREDACKDGEWRSHVCEAEEERRLEELEREKARAEQESKRRVEEIAMRLEAEERERQREAARGKEECARNRMSSLARDRASREEACTDVEWRRNACAAQELERKREVSAAHDAAEEARRQLHHTSAKERELVLRKHALLQGWRSDVAARQEHACADAGDKEARRLEIRLVALSSRHRLFSEKRESVARKLADAEQGKEGCRARVAQVQTCVWNIFVEQEKEMARERERLEEEKKVERMKVEQESKRRVEEIAMRLEAEERERQREAAREKEECARNRMSSLARDRASREDACKDGEWRSHVCEAEEERRLEELEREKARAEQESKRRVEEIAMRLEAEERERQREAAWEKEECARNRMASLARDRASREEASKYDLLRRDECAAQGLLRENAAAAAEAAAREEAMRRAVEEAARIAAEQEATRIASEQEAACIAAELAARDAALIEAHCLTRQARQDESRQASMEMAWSLREVAIRQDEACKEVQRIESVAAQLRAEAVAHEESLVETNRCWSQEHDAMLRSEVLEADWARKNVCVGEEEAWKRVWSAEQGEWQRRKALELAQIEANLLAQQDREQAQREGSLEASWCYKAVCLEQEHSWLAARKIEDEAEASRRMAREEEERALQKMQKLCKAESERRERELREDAMESAWVRRGVAAVQEEVWESTYEEDKMQREKAMVEQGSKQRVEEIAMRLEAEERERQRETAREKEECARNRMSSLARDRASREEAADDEEWRREVRQVQQQRRELFEIWERERADINTHEAKVREMYREREEVMAEEAARAADKAAREQALEVERRKLQEEMMLQRKLEISTAEEARTKEAGDVRVKAQEEFERMKERAIAKIEQEEAAPQIFGPEEFDVEVKHLRMQELDDLRAPPVLKQGTVPSGLVFEEGEDSLVVDKLGGISVSVSEEEQWLYRDRAFEEMMQRSDRDDQGSHASDVHTQASGIIMSQGLSKGDPTPLELKGPFKQLPSVVSWLRPLPCILSWPPSIESSEGVDAEMTRETETLEEKKQVERMKVEQESKRRVEEIAMRLEAEERERQREAAREKEECARNRMSSLARDRASREDACKDGAWRSHVCEVEEERRLEELEREKARAEQESKRRVEEIAMRLEADERAKQREAAREKEECARNRMASLARDRASRGETREDDAWRLYVSHVQEMRRRHVLGEEALQQLVQENAQATETAAGAGTERTAEAAVPAPEGGAAPLAQGATAAAAAAAAAAETDEQAAAAQEEADEEAAADEEGGGAQGASSPVFLHTKELSELNSILRDAAKAGNMQGVLSALELGADVSSKGDESSLTPLHLAAVGGHSDVVELLAEVGAHCRTFNLDARNAQGMTPLHLAAYNGQAIVAAQLVERGADLTAVTSKSAVQGLRQLTPAELALAAKHKGTAKMLLDLMRTLRDAQQGVAHIRHKSRRSSRRDSKTLSLHSNSEFERSRRSPRDLKDGYGEYSTRTYTYSAIRDPRDSLVDPRDSLIDSPSLSQISSLASRR